ncbi:hypothetical protein ACFPLB_08715 [Aquamicrobium segne]|uniref:Uncharacterized protein n=1 Tax=Aquamicrobium segne TaxID=469547 RepID=A0ABW0GWK1_9HYPH
MAYLKQNRPFHRYLARIYCRLCYGALRSHNEEWWPGLRLQKPGLNGAAGSVEYKGRVLAPLLPFSAKEKLEELIIVGSGPSLASQAIDKIPMSSAILLNGAVHLLSETDERPYAIVIEDERFIWRHWPDLCRLVPEPADVYFSTSVIRSLCETAPDWLARQRIHHLDFVHRPYLAPRRNIQHQKELPFLMWSDDGEVAISLQPRSGIVAAGSVAVTAAQLALSMQPAKIGLAGIDLTSTQMPRFYEQAGNQAMSRLDVAVERILAAFSLIAKEGGNRDIVFENYSPISLLINKNIPYSSRLEPVS